LHENTGGGYKKVPRRYAAIPLLFLIICILFGSCRSEKPGARDGSRAPSESTEQTSKPADSGHPATDPPGKDEPGIDTSGGKPADAEAWNPADNPAAPHESPYRIYLEKGSHTITVFKKDESGEYSETVMTFRVAIGSRAEETPAGLFVLESSARWHRLPSGKYVQYASFFGDGLFLSSALYDTDDINTLSRESYISIGENITSGSIYTTADAASWVYENCPVGTMIQIVEGSPLNTVSDEPAELNPDWYFTDPTDPQRPEIKKLLPTDYKIYVEKGTFTITVFSKGNDGNYSKPVRSYPTSIGKTAGRTPAGTFAIGEKERWHTFPAPFIGGFAQFASHFHSTLLIHSPVYGIKDINYMVPESYEEIGTMCTAGCLRTTTEGAYWIYTYCPEGTVVEIVNGSPMGNRTPELPMLNPSNPWKDPTDPFRPVSEWNRTGTVKASDGKDYACLRTGPGDEYGLAGKLLNGTKVTITDYYEDWYKINFFKEVAFIKADCIRPGLGNLEPFSETLHVYRLPEIKAPALDEEKGKELINDLVDVRSVIDTIEVNLVYATDDNFTGKKLYPLDVCLLQRSTAEKLKKAQELFLQDGYSIKIYDAYRPYSIQKALFEVVNDPQYIADPNKASLHNRGAAVDITLTDPEGNEIVMPCPVHTLSPEAHVDNPDMSEDARKNLKYMQDVMVQCGFYVYPYEWWHFTDLDCLDYMVTDYDFTEIIFYSPPGR
jgi:D-alanyl-D-alanine dipeptidase